MESHGSEPPGTELPTELYTGPRARHHPGSLVLTCATCGCRLTARESVADGGRQGPDAAWRHYEGNAWDRDARGHRLECADVPHRITPAGEPLPD
jgi:hypothetical protein